MSVYRFLSLYVAAAFWFVVPMWVTHHRSHSLLGMMFLVGLVVTHLLYEWVPPFHRAVEGLLNFGTSLFGLNAIVYFIVLPFLVVKEIVKPTPDEFFTNTPAE